MLIFNICRRGLTPSLIKKSWTVFTRYGRYATAKWSSTQDIQTFELLWSYSMCSNFFKDAESHTGWKTNSSFPSGKSNDRVLGKVLNLNISTNLICSGSKGSSELFRGVGWVLAFISSDFLIGLWIIMMRWFNDFFCLLFWALKKRELGVRQNNAGFV